MKKGFLLVFILLLGISMLGCAAKGSETQLDRQIQSPEAPQQADENDMVAVVRLVEDFGSKLQKVPLQAPKDALRKSIQENYGNLVSPKLLEEWLGDPQNVPGRLTSSPWPEGIEIINIEKLSEEAYRVLGEIIEITSAEKAAGGAAAKRAITLVVKKMEKQWLIDAVTLGAYIEN